MVVDEVLKELEIIKSTFRAKIITSNYKQINPDEISWDNYNTGIFKNIYAKEYEYIVRNRQYSFLLSDDKGCVQFYYQFHRNTIQKLKMAYYPYPVELNESKEEIENLINDSNDMILMEYYYDLWNIFSHNFELNVNDETLKKLVMDSIAHGNNESTESLLLAKLDYKYKTTNSSHIRVDYDANVKSHNKCEIQIGAINYIRFPLKKMISPFLFFEFIFKNIFKANFDDLSRKTSYKTHKSLAKKKSFDIPGFNEESIFLIHKD
tara:strand:+ start:130 stop:921 length:792 start_codon:yes stop_codon:yes gene_type:complete